MTLFMLFLHLLSGVTTMINGGRFYISNKSLFEVIELHKTHPVFFKRKLTTLIIDFFSELFSIQIGHSFVLVNFGLFFICGLLLYHLSRQVIKDLKINLISVFIFYLCFSNLFAFFSPVYTYDEPLQFCFILLSFIFFNKEMFFGFIISFSLALITRETAVILIPGLFIYFAYNNKVDFKKNIKKSAFWSKIIVLAVPVIIYSIYSFYVMKNSVYSESSIDYFLLRFARVGYNFQNLDFTIETIGAFVIMYLLPAYFLYQVIKKKNVYKSKYQKHIRAFYLTFIINTIIVLLSARVRELRLLVIPLFFLWPVFGSMLNDELKLITKKQNYLKLLKNAKSILIFLSLNVLNFLVSFKIYHPTLGPKLGVFNVYLFLSINLIILFELIKYNKKMQLLP